MQQPEVSGLLITFCVTDRVLEPLRRKGSETTKTEKQKKNKQNKQNPKETKRGFSAFDIVRFDLTV